MQSSLPATQYRGHPYQLTHCPVGHSVTVKVLLIKSWDETQSEMWTDLGWLSSLEFMIFSKIKLCTRSKCIKILRLSMMVGQNLTDSLPASCVAPAATKCWTSQPGYFKNQHLLSRQVAKKHIIDGPPCSSPYILTYKDFGYGRILDRQSDSESDKLTQDWKMQTCQSPLGSYIVELEFQILSSPAATRRLAPPTARRRRHCCTMQRRIQAKSGFA